MDNNKNYTCTPQSVFTDIICPVYTPMYEHKDFNIFDDDQEYEDDFDYEDDLQDWYIN